MINFTVITDTPQRLANFLVSRDIIRAVPNGPEGPVGTHYEGVLTGLEWINVPNPIITAPGSGVPGQPGYVPPTYDDRKTYLVKFSQDMEEQKAAGFRNWILANSSTVTAPPNYMINGEHAGDARKIDGESVWVVHDRPERFGVWQ